MTRIKKKISKHKCRKMLPHCRDFDSDFPFLLSLVRMEILLLMLSTAALDVQYTMIVLHVCRCKSSVRTTQKLLHIQM